MQRRSLLRILTVGGTIGTSIGVGTSTTNLVQSVQAQSESGWQQQQRLVAPDGEPQNGFGYNVEISDDGTTALIVPIVTASQPSPEPVYVYVIEGGQWTFQQKITSPEGDSKSGFGSDIALSGDGSTALVGAPDAVTSSFGTTPLRSGKVYVFTREGGNWLLQDKLKTSVKNGDDELGASVSLSNSGDTALIGVQQNSVVSKPPYQCVVFTRNDSSWTQEDKLSTNDVVSGDRFGSEVALSGDGSTALISAKFKDIANSTSIGTAYIFTKDGDTWSQQQKLTGDSKQKWGPFGISVSLSDDGATALIGSRSTNTETSGIEESAYVFSRNNGEWSQERILVTDSDAARQNNSLPVALSDDGTTAVVADIYEAESTGAAYLFSNVNGTWSQQQKLTVDINEPGIFGSSVAVSGDGNTILAGSSFENTEDGNQAGATYVFWADRAGDDDDQSPKVPSELDDQITAEQYTAVLDGDDELTAGGISSAVNQWATTGTVNGVDVGASELSALVNYWAA